jgi:hypothetical protein
MPDTAGNTVCVPVMECLHKRGYELFAERVKALIKEHGKIRILFDMVGFHERHKETLWFDINNSFPDVERVAFVGDLKWEKNIGVLCKPFPNALLRYFTNESESLKWVNTDELENP